MPQRDHADLRIIDTNPNMRVVRITHLEHDNRRLREVMRLIVKVAEGSTTANSLPNIARIARAALIEGIPHNPVLLDPSRLHGAEKGNRQSLSAASMA
ncbi:hypothetical protein AWB74_04481 [Caballeronia arvi]|uniref:Uncharacterized protein n=1 Tax=Caballeronia arvi TaxID=1777135 RepID=A0A158JX65_9BURK|nr:hypothetical protein [Caballeronia arvi]SAL73398.1 hypothetical protein AWB74_04481 [Caballeronia arvi]